MVNLEDIAERLDRIEAQLQQLTLSAAGGHTMLIGWEKIAAFTGKRPDTLRRYRDKTAFPVVRWGSRVATTTDLISAWLLEYDARRRAMGKGKAWGKIGNRKANRKEKPSVPEVRQPGDTPRRSETGRFESNIP